MTLLKQARQALLFRLLEAHEASTSYGRPAPWPRDVIVRIDAKQWPAAFDDDGRELLEALRAEARALQTLGAVRIVEHAGPARGELREVRLGPAEVDPALEQARRLGFLPLGDALAALTTTCASLRGGGPSWLDQMLDDVRVGAATANLSPLRISRERFKRDHHDVVDALRTAVALWRGESGWERVVSERLFGNSKRIASLRGELGRLLVLLDPRFAGLEAGDVGDVLEVCGLRRKPGFVACAGDFAIPVSDRSYRLADFTPSAWLPEAWLPMVARAGASTTTVTTIENEVPFFAYVEEAGGPAALGLRGELVVYVAGFPGPHVVALLAELRQNNPTLAVRHWGDADLGGLRIWWFLRKRLGPIALFRTTSSWVEQHAAGARSLPRQERGALAHLRDQLSAHLELDPEAVDVVAAVALADTLVKRGIKIEQERWSS
jgi:hypothetical protein